MIELHHLPTINASLNALAAVLLVTGRRAIRRGDVRRHSRCMVSAFITSILFLGTYLTYHTLRQMREGVGHTRFPGSGFAAHFYHTMLISHVLLAAIVPVLVIIVLRRALRRDFVRHRALARWAYPIWLYVSVTGVLIYLMLYHWPAQWQAA